LVSFKIEEQFEKKFYSSSGTSDSAASLQLNCNKRKFVTNNAPKTIKKVVIISGFI